jgi:16S rRNA G966 N2-methylase RsmD
MESILSRRAEYTFLDNLKRGRHRWLRLTPAYSARLVAERLQHYPSSTRVLDPFGGTGTTALLAAQMGYPATLVEINPFLVWLSRAKTRIYTPDAIQSALEWGQMLVHTRRDYTHGSCEPPSIRDIQRWWDAESLAWLTTMRHAITTSGAAIPQASLDLVLIAFARCVIEFSNASYHHPSLSFRENRQLALDMQSHDLRFLEYLHETARDAHANPCLEPSVIEADARTLTPLNGNTYDLVITSPPYANRISYIRELRPYMYWLGFLTNGAEAGELDWKAIGGTWGVATSRLKLWQPQLPVPVKVADIASRIRVAHPVNGVLMANYVVKYFEDMHLHIRRLTTLLTPGATVHYIVGNSSFYGVLVPVEQILAELLVAHGFSEVRVMPIRKRNCKKELCEFEIWGRL